MIANINPTLAAFLNSRPKQMWMADCYSFILQSGLLLRYTSWGTPVTITSPNPAAGAQTVTWLPGPPNVQRQSISYALGLETAQTSVHISAPVGGGLVNGTPILNMIAAGSFNLAQYYHERAFAPVGGAWLGTLLRFFGEVTDAQDGGRIDATLTCKAMTHRFDVDWPTTTIQPNCRNTLYDANCTLSKAAHGIAGTAQPGSSINKIVGSAILQDAIYDLGTITFTSGALAGLSYTIKLYKTGIFYPISPMLVAPLVGDGYIAYVGCDKTTTTCTNKFGNLANFRGFPFVPDPLVSYG